MTEARLMRECCDSYEGQEHWDNCYKYRPVDLKAENARLREESERSRAVAMRWLRERDEARTALEGMVRLDAVTACLREFDAEWLRVWGFKGPAKPSPDEIVERAYREGRLK